MSPFIVSTDGITRNDPEEGRPRGYQLHKGCPPKTWVSTRKAHRMPIHQGVSAKLPLHDVQTAIDSGNRRHPLLQPCAAFASTVTVAHRQLRKSPSHAEATGACRPRAQAQKSSEYACAALRCVFESSRRMSLSGWEPWKRYGHQSPEYIQHALRRKAFSQVLISKVHLSTNITAVMGISSFRLVPVREPPDVRSLRPEPCYPHLPS